MLNLWKVNIQDSARPRQVDWTSRIDHQMKKLRSDKVVFWVSHMFEVYVIYSFKFIIFQHLFSLPIFLSLWCAVAIRKFHLARVDLHFIDHLHQFPVFLPSHLYQTLLLSVMIGDLHESLAQISADQWTRWSKRAFSLITHHLIVLFQDMCDVDRQWSWRSCRNHKLFSRLTSLLNLDVTQDWFLTDILRAHVQAFVQNCITLATQNDSRVDIVVYLIKMTTNVVVHSMVDGVICWVLPMAKLRCYLPPLVITFRQ